MLVGSWMEYHFGCSPHTHTIYPHCPHLPPHCPCSLYIVYTFGQLRLTPTPPRPACTTLLPPTTCTTALTACPAHTPSDLPAYFCYHIPLLQLPFLPQFAYLRTLPYACPLRTHRILPRNTTTRGLPPTAHHVRTCRIHYTRRTRTLHLLHLRRGAFATPPRHAVSHTYRSARCLLLFYVYLYTAPLFATTLLPTARARRCTYGGAFFSFLLLPYA